MDSITRKQLKQLVNSQFWQSIYVAMGATIDKWYNEPVKAEDQFNTTWNMAYKEGRIAGIKEFMDIIEKEALDN